MITEKNATVTETSVAQPRQLPTTFLPWIIAAGALIVYLATLNHWVSFNSLPQVARVSGWTWQPELYGPVYWLATYPFRWLPAKAIPLALNLFSLVCAVLTLALLARSVTLLPHDRTHPQRLREKSAFSLLTIRTAWLPPLLAVIVCGLQLTFWEHATSASGEMLDLLMFAYIIRSLLEFRIDERESWLTRAAFIYGLAMTNNWGMIGFFPLFLAALVWIKGLSFFNLRFLGRMALCGLAGLILYLLLPIVQSRAEIAHVPFWAGLTANIGSQKGILTLLFKNFRPILALLGLTSLLPIFIISIRWASYFGDSSKLGVALATIMFHIVHALFLVACIWVALDPPVSPRNKGAGIPFLTFYYLGALSVGYFIGYFLLVFGTRVDRYRRVPALLSLFNNAVIAAIWILALATPALLLDRNLPQIRATNGGLLRDYTALLTKGVSAQSAVILSDDPRKLMLLRSASTQNATSERYLFLDTTSMKWPDYHRFLRKIYPRRWQSLPAKERQQVFDNEILDTVTQLAQSNTLYYLHPSFGYYFESFYLEPHGLVYKLDPYPTNAVFTPPIGNDLIAENQAFWEQADTATLKPLQALLSPAGRENQPALMAGFMRRAHLAPETNRTASTLAGFYSRALDYWGVTMQKAGRWPEAAAHFQRALELNPDNVVAQVNLECNHNLQAGRKSSVQPSKAIEDAFGKFRNWVDVMAENGPFDEPTFCYAQGRLHIQGSLFRQAAHQFERVKELAPEHLDARLLLAQLYLMGNLPEEALKLIDEIHSKPELITVHRTNLTDVLSVETSAHLARNDIKGAEAAVQSALEKYPNDEDLLATATRAYMIYGRYSNALSIIDQQLKLTPNEPSALINKGYAYIQLKAFDLAIPPLTKALTLNPTNDSALLNRGISFLKSGKLDEAQSDYEGLQKLHPTAFQVYFGLQEIAYQKKDTNAAIRYCQLYLSNSPPNNVGEAKAVSERLKELTSRKP